MAQNQTNPSTKSVALFKNNCSCDQIFINTLLEIFAVSRFFFKKSPKFREISSCFYESRKFRSVLAMKESSWNMADLRTQCLENNKQKNEFYRNNPLLLRELINANFCGFDVLRRFCGIHFCRYEIKTIFFVLYITFPFK